MDYIIANSCSPADDETLLDRYASESKYPIVSESSIHDPRLILARLWLDREIARHDGARLASLVSATINAALERIPSPHTASPSAL